MHMKIVISRFDQHILDKQLCSSERHLLLLFIQKAHSKKKMRIGNMTEEEEAFESWSRSQILRGRRSQLHTQKECPGFLAKQEELRQNKHCVIIPLNFQLGNPREKPLPLIKKSYLKIHNFSFSQSKC